MTNTAIIEVFSDNTIVDTVEKIRIIEVGVPGAPGQSQTFRGLTDTPNSYVGFDGFAVTVDESGNAVVFTDISGHVTDGANVGGGTEVFRDKIGQTLNFRTLTGSQGVTAQQVGDTIDFAAKADEIDHDALLNYVATQHIDHTTVDIIAGVGLSGGGDLTATRTIDLENTAVTPGSFTYASITVDAQGRLTAASSGVNPEIIVGANVGGGTEVFRDKVGETLNFRTLTGSQGVTAQQIGDTIDFAAKASEIDHDALLNYVATQHIDHTTVDIIAGVGLTGGGDLTASRTIDLENTAVTPGSFTNADITVDAQGRITAAASGGGGGGTPGGALTSIQFNNAGAFGGFGTWDGTKATINQIDTTTKYQVGGFDVLRTSDGGEVGGQRNLLVGDTGNTTLAASRCVFVGTGAGQNVSSNDQTFVGNLAGANLSGSDCTGIGSSALENNNATNCTGVGHEALKDNTGATCTGVGRRALENNTGNDCTGIGVQSLQNNTAANCSGVGFQALQANTGSAVVGVGVRAAKANTANNVVAIGRDSLASNTARDCVGVGSDTLELNQGVQCTAIGSGSFRSHTTGTNNIGIGYNSGQNNITGSDNIFIGVNAGENNVAGSGNVFIGDEAGQNETGSNLLYIANSNTADPLIRGEFDNKLLRINGGLEVAAAVAFDTFGNVTPSDGEIWFDGTTLKGRQGGTTSDLIGLSINLASTSGGIVSGGEVTINGGDNTLFDVAAGVAIIDNWTDPTAPFRTTVEFGPFIGESLPNIAAVFTVLAIDAAGLLIKQSGSQFTPQQERLQGTLQALSHASGVQIDAISENKTPAYQKDEAILDYIDALGPINSGNDFTANGVNLNIDKSAGTTTLPFINATIDPQNPAIKSNASQTVAVFIRSYQDGSGGDTIVPGQTEVDPNFWDDGTGVLNTVAPNKWTIKRIFFFGQTDQQAIAYGQAEYNSKEEAKAAIFTEAFTPPGVAIAGTFTTAILLKEGTTDLSDTADAEFIDIAQQSLAGGASTGDMEKAVYDPTGVNADAFDFVNAHSTALAVNAVLGLEASGAGTTSLLTVTNSTGLISTLKSNSDRTSIALQSNTGTHSFAVTDVSGVVALSITSAGLLNGPSIVSNVIVNATDDARQLDASARMFSSQDAITAQTHDFFFNPNGDICEHQTEGDNFNIKLMQAGGAFVVVDELGAVAFSVLDNGNGLFTGNLDFASTKGITFNAGDLLNDYEEGTFTPTISTNAVDFTSVTYDAAITGGLYRIIGKALFWQASIRTDAITIGSASGSLTIEGFPLPASTAGAGQAGAGSVIVGRSSEWVNNPESGDIDPGQSVAELRYRASHNSDSINVPAATSVGTGANDNLIRISGWYPID